MSASKIITGVTVGGTLLLFIAVFIVAYVLYVRRSPQNSTTCRQGTGNRGTSPECFVVLFSGVSPLAQDPTTNYLSQSSISVHAAANSWTVASQEQINLFFTNGGQIDKMAYFGPEYNGTNGVIDPCSQRGYNCNLNNVACSTSFLFLATLGRTSGTHQFIIDPTDFNNNLTQGGYVAYGLKPASGATCFPSGASMPSGTILPFATGKWSDGGGS